MNTLTVEIKRFRTQISAANVPNYAAVEPSKIKPKYVSTLLAQWCHIILWSNHSRTQQSRSQVTFEPNDTTTETRQAAVVLFRTSQAEQLLGAGKLPAMARPKPF